MVTRFERPGIHFVPKVYSYYSYTNGDSEEEFYIQDLPQDKLEEAAEFMIQYYKKDETFQKAIPVSEVSLKDFYVFIFKQKVALGCYKKGTNELVGINALSVKSKGIDTSFKNEDETFRKMRQAYLYINNFYDVFDHYNVNYYLYAHGLAVKTEYRGKGIATELLKARVALLKELDLAVTASIFTTIGSQKAAFKVGFREDFSISYETLQEKFENFDFSSANSDNCKLLSLQIKL